METSERACSAQSLNELLKQHRRTIQSDSKFNIDDPVICALHSQTIACIGDNYLSREFRKFIIDEHNSKILRFLLLYFNRSKKAEEVFPSEDYKIHKQLLLIGEPGTGKTLLMQIFSDYLKMTLNSNYYRNISVTELMNYYKINSHIDRFTYNEINSDRFEGNPFPVCLNDIGLETENQKSYGTSLDSVIDEFLYARYEIYQQRGIMCHLTSNLSVAKFKDRFGPRLIDRFKSYNVISLCGHSRRT